MLTALLLPRSLCLLTPPPHSHLLYQGCISMSCGIKREFSPGLKLLPVVLKSKACPNDKWWQFVQASSLCSQRMALNGLVLLVSVASVTRSLRVTRPHTGSTGIPHPFILHILNSELTRTDHIHYFICPPAATAGRQCSDQPICSCDDEEQRQNKWLRSRVCPYSLCQFPV